MKRNLFAIIVLTLCSGLTLPGQTESPSPTATPSFEELPELKASDILKPELLKGPHYSIREPVPTASGMNHFTIDSDFGLFEADGNEMLVIRLKEIDGIARLQDVSRTDQFKDSLIAAAKSPLNSAKNIVKDPAQAISNVPKGIMKFMGRARDTVKNMGKSDGAEDGSVMKDALGYSDKKRKIALEMGIDPYSTNPILQKQLDEVAWASWAGGFTFSAATFPISGPVGAALTVTGLNSSIDQLLREKSPEELAQINRATFKSMGGTSVDSARIVNGGAFTPTQATAFAQALKSMKVVANRAAFIHVAAQKSSNEADATFCVETATLMSQINEKTPLAKIAMLGDFPICVAQDGTIILALQWDYAAWTAGAAWITKQVEDLAGQSGEKKPVTIVLSGQMSPLLQQELKNRGFTIQDHAAKGPLKSKWLTRPEDRLSQARGPMTFLLCPKEAKAKCRTGMPSRVQIARSGI
jgi:hypothetical protein